MRRIYIPITAVLAFVFSLLNQALGQTSPVPQVGYCAGFAKTIPVRDFGAAFPEDFKSSKRKPKDSVINVKNEIPLKNVKPGLGGETDAGIQNRTAIVPDIAAPITSFDGLSSDDNFAAYSFRVEPPDANGDIGPNHYVQTTNLLVRIFNKNGTPATAPFKMSTLFAALGPPASNSDDGDPIVLYDQLADRWLLSQFLTTLQGGRTSQVIAISQTGDPTGAYFVYNFIMPNVKFNDYPHFGVWPDAYYMSDNQFNQAGTAYLGAGAFAFDRAKLLAGDPTASFIYFDQFTVDPTRGGQLPSDLDGYVAPPLGTPNLFMEFRATEYGDPNDALRIFAFHADFVTPANSTFTQVGTDLVLGAFDVRDPAGRDDVAQPPPATASQFLDAIGDRLMYRLACRILPGGVQSYVGNFTVNVSGVNPTTPSLYQAGIKWFELRRNAGTGAMSVLNEGIYAPGAGDGLNGRDIWMAAIAQDGEGNLGLGFSASSLTLFPSVHYTGRFPTDAAGTMAQGENILVTGNGSQQDANSRWGDYSSMSVDPTDDCTFWYTQEYYSNSGSFDWKTRIGSFKVNSACVPAQRGTITGTVTNCTTGLPIPNAVVTTPDGFFSQTNASGQYSITAAPGTYTINVTKVGGFLPCVVNNVIVTNGGNTIVNCCLTPIPVIISAGATITAESCVPANNLIDPVETVTVSFCIQNTGTVNSSNLVATLQATGGVTSPSGPQNYGVVVAGGATVCRPFTFTSNSICGGVITATLQLQDGASNLGTVVFSFVTGAPALGTNLYTTGNIATPIPDVSTVDIPLTISEARGISDVNVRFRLNHTFDGDLVISLVHPDNTVIPLVANRGGAGTNFGTGANDCSGTPTIIDDAAITAISAGAAPFAGTFKPESPLSVLNGKPSNGVWKLRITDGGSLDVGTVGCFSIELKTSQCCGDPAVISSAGATITAEGCVPANGAVDPGETVTVSFCVQNIGVANTANLVATLQVSGGVTSPSGPQNYGVVVAAGPPVCRNFTFTANGTCGGTITATLQLQDGATNLGVITYTFTLGTSPVMPNCCIPPPCTVTCPANITVNNSTAPPGQCGAIVNYPAPTTTGVCGTITMSHPSGSLFPLGTTTVTATSSAGPTCSFTITVNDTQAPAITCPANIIVNNNPAAACGAVVNFGIVSIIDPCGVASLTQIAGPPDGSIFPVGITTVTYRAADPAGNSSTCSFTVEVKDVTPPVITCPANITVTSAPLLCGAVVNYPAPTVTDNCPGVTVTSIPLSGTFFPVGTHTVTATATDASGNSCYLYVYHNRTTDPQPGIYQPGNS